METDRARAGEYALLAALLSHSPDADMIERLARLSGDATQLGAAHAALGSAAASMKPERIEREYFDLFVGLGGGELFPYASYYLTGYLHGRPLARLRETLKQIGLERTEGQSEPEDHVAVLFEVMAGLASGQIIAPGGTDRNIFENHLKPWVGRFFRTSSAPSLRHFTKASDHSAASSWKSKPRHFRFRHRRSAATAPSQARPHAVSRRATATVKAVTVRGLV